MSQSKQWIMVRIDRTTHLLLQRLKTRFESEVSGTASKRYDMIDRFGMSLDAVIRELVRREEGHRERSRKAARKRKTIVGQEPDPTPGERTESTPSA